MRAGGWAVLRDLLNGLAGSRAENDAEALATIRRCGSRLDTFRMARLIIPRLGLAAWYIPESSSLAAATIAAERESP